MRGGALVAGECRAWLISHMALVIGTVGVLSIPAGREDDSGADATGARFVRELSRVTGVAGSTVATHRTFARRKATMANSHAALLLGAECRVPRKHSETLQGGQPRRERGEEDGNYMPKLSLTRGITVTFLLVPLKGCI